MFRYLTLIAILPILTLPAGAAEIVRLDEENYSDLLPGGKEVDAIIGDYLLRSDELVVVVADTVPERKANMTTPRVAGCVIDMTLRDDQNDQLTAYYPTAMHFLFTNATVVKQQGDEVVVRVESEPTAQGLKGTVTYALRDGERHLSVQQEYANVSTRAIRTPLSDSVRADTTFTKVPRGVTNFFWVHDDWFRQSYGLTVEGFEIDSQSDARRSTIFYQQNGGRTIEIPPGETVTIEGKLLCADNLIALKALAAELSGQAVRPLHLSVRQTDGKPVPHAQIDVTSEGESFGSARTDSQGDSSFALAPGTYSVKVQAIGRGETTVELNVENGADVHQAEIRLPNAPLLAAKITENGKPMPCKLQFQGIDGTDDPRFGPNTQGPGVNNLYYSHNGDFETVVPEGTYRVLISYGPEYDLATKTIEMKAGETTRLEAEMVRVVDSTGWISSDPHSHSTPSGDNVTSMHGRVLNILSEHLEFVPCTEHNRVDSYEPVLSELGCLDRLATCTALELTGSPLPLNHQNAFPIVMHLGRQDNGAPQTDPDPELQIRRLATWDNNSEKYVHINHPDLGWMFYDRSGDGMRDAGYYRMLGYQDAIEVWGNNPLSCVEERILAFEPITARGRNDRLFNWLQLLNQGYRIVGVANTDAHYTDHGSGWIRNFVKCSTDVPSEVDAMEMVREYKAGHIVMSNGPFLEAKLVAGGAEYIPGDRLVAADSAVQMHVKVQCANWYDVNRVQVLVNGRPLDEYNFTREKNPDMFSDEVVKFDQQFELKLDSDSHLIVVAIGEGLGFGDVLGSVMKEAPPTAIANPIYVDVDGDGFRSNGDTLGHPLPTKAQP